MILAETASFFAGRSSFSLYVHLPLRFCHALIFNIICLGCTFRYSGLMRSVGTMGKTTTTTVWTSLLLSSWHHPFHVNAPSLRLASLLINGVVVSKAILSRRWNASKTFSITTSYFVNSQRYRISKGARGLVFETSDVTKCNHFDFIYVSPTYFLKGTRTRHAIEAMARKQCSVTA